MKKKHLSFILFIHFVLLSSAFGQQTKLDSLLQRFAKSKTETEKINSLILLCDASRRNDAEQSVKYGQEALQLSNKINFNPGKEKVGIALGASLFNLGKFDEASAYINSALIVADSIGDKKCKAQGYINLGVINDALGKYDVATDYFLNASKIEEELNDKREISVCDTYLGSIDQHEKKYDDAMNYEQQAAKLIKQINDTADMASVYVDIANIDENLGKYKEAMDYDEKAIKIQKECNDEKGLAGTLCNAANIYVVQKKFVQAMQNLNEALKMQMEIGDSADLPNTYNNIGGVYYYMNDKKDAIENFKTGLGISEATHYAVWEENASGNLAEVYEETGDFKDALNYQKLFKRLSDSLVNTENDKHIAQMQVKYDLEKKDKQIVEFQKQKEIDNAIAIEEKNKKNIILFSGIAIALLLTVFALFMVNRYKLTQKQNALIGEQKKLVEEKNHEITDSITYAKRIQQASLPDKREIFALLPDSFIFFRPKDIVSGDFYFFASHNHRIFLAAADCTGHGIPGALMSMIGLEKLKEAISDSHVPGEILSLVNRGIKKSLRQSESQIEAGKISTDVRDGMDVALVSIEKANEKSQLRLSYSAANRPLWIIKKNAGEMEEVAGTKKAIGGLTEDEQNFETHELLLDHGDSFYLFSDGFADQFGGPKGKKLTTKKFKEKLFSIREKSMEEQEKLIVEFFDEWRGEKEQLDDILVMGVRV